MRVWCRSREDYLGTDKDGGTGGGKRKGCRDLSNHKSTTVSDRLNVDRPGHLRTGRIVKREIIKRE